MPIAVAMAARMAMVLDMAMPRACQARHGRAMARAKGTAVAMSMGMAMAMPMLMGISMAMGMAIAMVGPGCSSFWALLCVVSALDRSRLALVGHGCLSLPCLAVCLVTASQGHAEGRPWLAQSF